MRYSIDKNRQDNSNYPVNRNLLVAVFPGVYCPRCGSREIGPRRIAGNEVIWKCFECDVDFKLLFPASTRF